jgi:hypothetical protein
MIQYFTTLVLRVIPDCMIVYASLFTPDSTGFAVILVGRD